MVLCCDLLNKVSARLLSRRISFSLYNLVPWYYLVDVSESGLRCHYIALLSDPPIN